MIESIKFFNSFASSYDTLAKDHNWTSPVRMYNQLRPFLKHHQTFLDVGIGTGLSSEMYHDLGLTITGIDGSETMLDQCRTKGFAQQLDLVDLESEPLPYVKESFDVVLSVGVFYFFNEEVVTRILHDAHRVLKPDGLLGFTFEPDEYAIVSKYNNYGNCNLRKTKNDTDPMVTYRHNQTLFFETLPMLNMELIGQPDRYHAYTSPTTGQDVEFMSLIFKKKS